MVSIAAPCQTTPSLTPKPKHSGLWDGHQRTSVGLEIKQLDIGHTSLTIPACKAKDAIGIVQTKHKLPSRSICCPNNQLTRSELLRDYKGPWGALVKPGRNLGASDRTIAE